MKQDKIQCSINWVKKVTPLVTFRYPHFNEPDTFMGSDPSYKVSCDVDVTTPEGKAFKAYLDSIVDTVNQELLTEKERKGNKAYTVAYPYEMLEDDDGNETSVMRVKMKTKAEFKGEPRDLKVVDKNKQPFDMTQQIWGGTTGKIAYFPSAYKMPSTRKVGVSLKISAVQIHNLVTGGGGLDLFDDEGGVNEEQRVDEPKVSEDTSDF